MSSHREAPAISKDPAADSTDVYAFVSPDRPDTVTLIANYVPLQDPAGGPNFFEFGDDVMYQILVDNDGDGKADVWYQFRFWTEVEDRNTFLYNTGPITSLTSSTWNRRQYYRVTRVTPGTSEVLAAKLGCPPCNIGPLSTPNYAGLAGQAIHPLPGGRRVFAGQRADGFYVDLGSVFDLLDLRPFQNLNIAPRPAAAGVNGLAGLNVHSIALQVPKSDLTRGGAAGTDATSPTSVIGVWTSASRQRARVWDSKDGANLNIGPWVQVSRMGNPLVNEVINPLGVKDAWNSYPPAGDSRYLQYVEHPELAGLLPVLYPTVFPNLAAVVKAGIARADLVAVLLTGIPAGIIKGFQNYTGTVQADMLRLNCAVSPTAKPSLLGLLGGDAAGFPNGRRVFDDVTTIELRAVAGATLPLVDPSFKPDAAVSLVYDDVDPAKHTPQSLASTLGVSYLSSFPYLGTPYDGFDAVTGTRAANAHGAPRSSAA